MSNFNVGKKLLPAEKAWKSFKATFQSKLQKLKTSRAIKRTKNYCINALNSIRLIVSRKLYALTRQSNTRSHYHFHYYRQQNQQKNSFSAIFVDELFSGRGPMHAARQYCSSAQPTKAKEMVASSSYADKAEDDDQGRAANVEKQHQIATSGVKILEKKPLPRKAETGESSTSIADDAWKIPLLPQFRGVDERAEEFITKFLQDIKLEREKSILEFEEMLARSA